MSIFKVEVKPGERPNKWPVVHFADVGSDENFVKAILELTPLVDAGLIMDTQREDVKAAIVSILNDGLVPAFLELRTIRALPGRNLPLIDRNQPFEDLARKLWRAYKALTQNAVQLMGFDIGFLFENDKRFAEGLKKFRAANPNLVVDYEAFLEDVRTSWQTELGKFRNNWIEHPDGKPPKDFAKFYTPQYAEIIFEKVWRAIVDMIPALLELKLPYGIKLAEMVDENGNPKWGERFRYSSPFFKEMV